MTDFTFSSTVNVRTLPGRGTVVKFSADEAVCLELAKRYSLLAVESFTAEAHVAPWKKSGVKIVGNVKASLIQPCAISAEPLDATVDEQVDALLVPEGSRLAQPKLDGEGEIVIDPDGADLPETFTGDTIDLAEIWLEFFVLGLNPYARIEGVELSSTEDDDAEQDEKISPFAALAALKKH